MTKRVLASSHGVAIIAEFDSTARRASTQAIQVLNLDTGHALLERIDVGFQRHERYRTFSFPEFLVIPGGETVTVLSDARLYELTELGRHTTWEVEDVTTEGERTFTLHVTTSQGKTQLQVVARQAVEFESNQYRARWYFDLEPHGKDISPTTT